MEPRKNLGEDAEAFRPDVDDGPRSYYEKAKEFSLRFYPDEVSRISSVNFANITPEFFFREYIWVVHATGFSAGAVSKFIERLVVAYGPWDILASEEFDAVMSRVAIACNNPAKAKAVWNMAKSMRTGIDKTGWEAWKQTNLSRVDSLSELPYIGDVTKFHLGRNIGLLDCVKPDLHLVRLADKWGFSSCEEMCMNMRDNDTIPLGIVDLYLWYAASTFGTIELKKDGGR